MKLPEEVAAILSLAAKGWGSRRISKELGISRVTVKRYLRRGGWQPYAHPRRSRKLGGLESFVEEPFHRHRGNGEVVRQELQRVHGVDVSLRTVERAVERAVSKGGGRGQGDGGIRDATGQTDADRLWTVCGGDRRRKGACSLVCGHFGLQPAKLRHGLSP